METVSYKELIATRDKLDKLLGVLGLPVMPSDRLHTAYRLLEDYEEIRLDSEKSREFFKKYKKAELNFALHDINALHHFWLFADDVEKEILREKLKFILSGNSLAENATNTTPRDTLFELQLFTQFKRVGLDAHLCAPNPDIEVHIGGKVYNIQCKKLYRPERKTIKRAINNAFKQLNKDILKNPASFGIVALSIEDFYTAGGKALVTETAEDALVNLSTNLDIFFKTFEALWHNPVKIRNQNTIALMAYISAITITKSNNLQSTGTYIGFTNTHVPPTEKFKEIEVDFSPLREAADRSNRLEN